jgi:hypothetical protein
MYWTQIGKNTIVTPFKLLRGSHYTKKYYLLVPIKEEAIAY